MELIITLPGTFPGDLAGLADATRHDNMMQRARVEWLVPQGNGGSLIRSIRISSARQVSDLPGESSPQGGIPATAAVIAEVVRTSFELTGSLRRQQVLDQVFGADCTYAEDVDVIAGAAGEGPEGLASFPVTFAARIDGAPAERHFLVTISETASAREETP